MLASERKDTRMGSSNKAGFVVIGILMLEILQIPLCI